MPFGLHLDVKWSTFGSLLVTLLMLWEGILKDLRCISAFGLVQVFLWYFAVFPPVFLRYSSDIVHFHVWFSSGIPLAFHIFFLDYSLGIL